MGTLDIVLYRILGQGFRHRALVRQRAAKSTGVPYEGCRPCLDGGRMGGGVEMGTYHFQDARENVQSKNGSRGQVSNPQEPSSLSGNSR